jgi:hypothetical protein
MKNCTLCKIEKPLSEFWPDRRRKSGLMASCKVCRKKSLRAYVASRPDYHRAVYDRTRSKTRERHLIRKYGITLADYEVMLKTQHGKCAICKAPESDQFKQVFHVDHCHASGRIRGLLCRGCNHMLGVVADNTEILQQAISYLKLC